MIEATIGKTKNAGFEFGIRKTFPLSLTDAWDLITSDTGIQIWLGQICSGSLANGERYKTIGGIEGMVKIYEPLSHIRLTWKLPDWDSYSTVQIRVISAKTGTTVSIHQERLLNSAQREEMKSQWKNVIKMLSEKTE